MVNAGAPIAEADLVARMRRQAIELNAVLDAFSVGAALVSSQGEILAINRAALDLFDLAGEADRPKLAPDLVRRFSVAFPDGSLVPLEQTPFRRALRGELVRDELLSLVPGGKGRRWVLVGAAPLGPPGAVHSVILNLVDVTRSREAEQERASLLRHVIDDLTPRLRAIEAQARTLHSGCAVATRASAEIHRAVRRMAGGLRELEAALRFDAASVRAAPELVDVKAFLLDLLEHAAEIDASRVIPVLPPGLPPALVDPDHLEMVVLELLRGALAGAPEGTDVALAAEAEPGGLRVTVASSGQDIEPEDLPRVFDRFFKTRGRPVGRLHLVRGLAEANGARVAAESGGGRGLAIHVVLPLRSR